MIDCKCIDARIAYKNRVASSVLVLDSEAFISLLFWWKTCFSVLEFYKFCLCGSLVLLCLNTYISCAGIPYLYLLKNIDINIVYKVLLYVYFYIEYLCLYIYSYWIFMCIYVFILNIEYSYAYIYLYWILNIRVHIFIYIEYSCWDFLSYLCLFHISFMLLRYLFKFNNCIWISFYIWIFVLKLRSLIWIFKFIYLLFHI